MSDQAARRVSDDRQSDAPQKAAMLAHAGTSPDRIGLGVVVIRAVSRAKARPVPVKRYA